MAWTGAALGPACAGDDREAETEIRRPETGRQDYARPLISWQRERPAIAGRLAPGSCAHPAGDRQ
jgi:hypothetical protein